MDFLLTLCFGFGLNVASGGFLVIFMLEFEITMCCVYP